MLGNCKSLRQKYNYPPIHEIMNKGHFFENWLIANTHLLIIIMRNCIPLSLFHPVTLKTSNPPSIPIPKSPHQVPNYRPSSPKRCLNLERCFWQQATRHRRLSNRLIWLSCIGTSLQALVIRGTILRTWRIQRSNRISHIIHINTPCSCDARMQLHKWSRLFMMPIKAVSSSQRIKHKDFQISSVILQSLNLDSPTKISHHSNEKIVSVVSRIYKLKKQAWDLLGQNSKQINGNFFRSQGYPYRKDAQEQEVVRRQKQKKFNWDNHITPEATLECLDDARLRREIIRYAARYIIDKCKEEDARKEAEIKARNDEKEIAAWFNQPRHHDIKLLDEAKQVIIDKYLKPVRDEIKRRKILAMYKKIFKDLNSFNRELKALSRKKHIRNEEIQALIHPPNTVSLESYMYALDRGAVIDFAISDMVGGKQSLMQKKVQSPQHHHLLEISPLPQ